MRNPIRHVLGSLLVICLVVAGVYADGPEVVRTGSFPGAGASAEVRAAVEEKGYRVTLDDGWTAEFWFSRALATATKDAPSALYPELTSGELVAVASFSKGITDYRGQAVPGGTYTLRYQYLPQDANHMGVSPTPDFLLAIPVAADANPAEVLPYKRLVGLSTKSTGTAHPAVIAMAAAGAPDTLVKDDQGMMVLTVEVPTSASGKSETLGIVVKGQAAQ